MVPDESRTPAGVTGAAPSRATDQPPQVSVVIPAYQVTPYIAETLASVFAQTFTDFEVIVVNDGCPDTVGLEQAIAPYRDRIRYEVQANAGCASARNTAIALARGRYVATLDGDDQWYPAFLERQVLFLDTHPDVDAVCSNAEFFGEGVETAHFMERNPSHFPATFTRLVRQEVVLLLSAVLMRRMALLEVGSFDGSLRRCEDFDLWLRLTANGSVISGQPEILARYRRRPGSLSAAEGLMLRDALRVVERVDSARLTVEERRALGDGRARLAAQLSLHGAKEALLGGDWVAARQAIDGARRVVAPARWWLARLGLRVAPRLVARAYRRMAGVAP